MLRLFVPPRSQASAFVRFKPTRWLSAAALVAATIVGSPALAGDRPLVAVIDGGVARTAELIGRPPDDDTDAEALAAVARITRSDCRLVQRLFSQIERVFAINRLRTITKEVVERPPARTS